MDRQIGTDGADRFEGLVLQIQITSPMPNVLRVRICHHHPAQRGIIKPDLDYDLVAPPPRIEDSADELIFSSGKLSVRIRKSSWDLQFHGNSGPITGGGRQVTEFIDGMFERGIPLSVFHFDCFWMKERHWCDFQWDPQAFPKPREMLQKIKARGVKICVWINPYISQLSPLFAEGRDHDYFLKRLDGSVFQRDAWQPGMALVDFTNPAAVKWYCGKLRALLDMGVDCFKTDFGEFIPLDVCYHDGSDPALMHNHYAYLYNKAVFELLENTQGKSNALVFARTASIGSQKFPVHWGGDCEATFESMAEDLRGGLSLCLSGPAFWSHDIGGFTGAASAQVYKRWIAFGLLSTHSRLHGSDSYRVPWLFDEESVKVLRHFTQLKHRLLPYLLSIAQSAHDRGWPAMRAMFLEFPDDRVCRYLDTQYMLGPSLLVAPIFRTDDIAEYYLPAGKWTPLLAGKTLDGGQWHREKLDFMHLPLFARQSSIIPISENQNQAHWQLGDAVTLNLFDIVEDAEIPLRLFSSDGQGAANFTCRRSGPKISVESDGRAKHVRILLRGLTAAAVGSNGMIKSEVPEGVLLDWTDPRKPITMTPQY